MKIPAALFLCLLSGPVLACYKTPPEQIVSHDELIARSSNVVLARVTKAELRGEYRVLYTFDVQRRLAGAGQRVFQLEGLPATTEGAQRSFNHHADPSFWRPTFGRLANDTDCKIHPTFSVGATYLVFLDEPRHRKSFELIIRTHGDPETRDRWLSYVERALARKDK